MSKPADFVVDNASGADVRTDLNNLFDAISINNGFSSGAPTTKYKYMWYADEASSGKMSFYKANASDKIDFISLTDGSFFAPNGSASNPSYTFPTSPSEQHTVMLWPFLKTFVALFEPTMAGMPSSLAIIAAWHVLPPRLVTIAEAFFITGSQSGSVISAIKTSPSLI